MILSDAAYSVTNNNIANLTNLIGKEISKMDAELLDGQKLCVNNDKKHRCFISSFRIKEEIIAYVTFRGTKFGTGDGITNAKSTVLNFILR